MIKRKSEPEIIQLLQEFPAVAILGPRQVGKTTIALEIASSLKPAPVYLDLESPSDLAKLSDTENYFNLHDGNLIILDEIPKGATGKLQRIGLAEKLGLGAKG